MVISGLGSSSKSGTEQMLSSKNELKLIHIGGSFLRPRFLFQSEPANNQNIQGLRKLLLMCLFQEDGTVNEQF